MALSAFGDRSAPPDDAAVEAVLGAAAPAWRALRAHAPELSGEWGFTSASTGWGLRLKEGARVIVYMTPCAGHFLASLALGERAMAAARAAGLAGRVLDAVNGARKYAEGYGVRVAVTGEEELAGIVALVAVKRAS